MTTAYINAVVNVTYQVVLTWLIFSTPFNIVFFIIYYYKPLPKTFNTGYILIIVHLALSILMMCWGAFWWTRGTNGLDPWQGHVVLILAAAALVSVLMQGLAFRRHILPISFLMLSEINLATGKPSCFEHGCD
jgi:hypothetical protein